MSESQVNEVEEVVVEDEARRNFLKSAGKFAAVTPPAITFLLGTSLGSKAIAASSGISVQPKANSKSWNHRHWDQKRLDAEAKAWNHAHRKHKKK